MAQVPECVHTITTRNMAFCDEYLMTTNPNVIRSIPFMTFCIGQYNLVTKMICSSLRPTRNHHNLPDAYSCDEVHDNTGLS